MKEKTPWDRMRQNPSLLMFVSYLAVIILFGLIMMTPLVSRDGGMTRADDAFFTVTSALCVTGLTTVNTLSHWNSLGHVLIILLIQLGGLGIMTAMAAFSVLTHRRISLSDRLILAEEKNVATPQGMVRLVRSIMRLTFAIEGAGALLLCFAFVPHYGWGQGLWYSVFHAVSAFCNAGFDLIGDDSVMPFAGSVIVMLTLAFLIILGGIGFGVMTDVARKRDWRRLTLHAKACLSVTAALLIGGTLLFLLIEMNNPDTLGPFPWPKKILGAFFQSTTTRTAGFAAMNQGAIRPASLLLTASLMLIGGSPAGTAGGFKTTTLLVEILSTRALVARHRHMAAFGRSLSRVTEKKASVIVTIMIGWVLLATFLLALTETGMALSDLFYEVASGVGTVGLTRGITSALSVPGRIILMLSMIFGKIGPLGVLVALSHQPKPKRYREAEGYLLIG